jgi:uncharacterized protein (TIGR03437 family)
VTLLNTGHFGYALKIIILLLSSIEFVGDVFSQTLPMKLSQTWLKAASDSGPLEIIFPTLEPAIYALLSQEAIAVRWNGHLLPAHQVSASGPQYGAAAALEFDIPVSLVTPGLYELVLWDMTAHQTLPYRTWVPVVMPTAARMFEANPEADRVVAGGRLRSDATNANDALEIFRLSTGELVQRIDLPPPQGVVAFTTDLQYAWIRLDESHPTLSRFNIETQQTDEQIQFSYSASGENSILGAQVYRQNPRILFVVTGIGLESHGTLRAFVDGNSLVDQAPAAWPLVFDERGRILINNSKLCEVSATAGFINCRSLTQNNDVLPVTAVWKNRFLLGALGKVLEIGTGKILGQMRPFDSVTYLAESNRLLLANGSLYFADADNFEVLARISWDVPYLSYEISGYGVSRIWGPDWFSGGAGNGILVGHLPQLLPAPFFQTRALQQSATGNPAQLAPGEIVTIYGQNLGPVSGSGPIIHGLQLGTEVETSRVVFDGVPGAILYADMNQINVVVPDIVAQADSVAVQVFHYGIPSMRVNIPATSYDPGVFSYPNQGRNYAAALNSEGQIQGPAAPLKRGGNVTLYATGLGLAINESADSIGARPAEIPVRPVVTIGGRPANLLYAGVSPGLTTGVTQLNITIPEDAPVGSAIELVLTIGNRSQGGAWLAIE